MALSAIGGAYLSQVVVTTEQKGQINGVKDQIGELKLTITTENSNTREIITLRFDAMAYRVNQLEERLKDVESIVRPPREPYSR